MQCPCDEFALLIQTGVTCSRAGAGTVVRHVIFAVRSISPARQRLRRLDGCGHKVDLEASAEAAAEQGGMTLTRSASAPQRSPRVCVNCCTWYRRTHRNGPL